MAKMMKSAFLICIGVAVLAASVQGKEVRLCEHEEYGGRCINPDIDRLCYNLGDFNDMASSINTDGACVLLWEHGGCTGENRRVAPGTQSHGNLGGINFNDVASSIQLCPKEEKNVKLCEDDEHRGRCVDLTISERCQDLGDLDDKITSADTRGGCMILWDNKGCSGDKRRVAPGTQGHTNFGGIGFNDRASSIQLCPRVRFLLYLDSSNEGNYREITWGEGDSIRQIGMNGHSRVRVYIHGYNSNAFTENSQLVKNNYLRQFKNIPVLLIDWEPLANEGVLDYSVVTQNHVPIVTAHLREFLSDMLRNRVINSFNQVHLIGHSLGGQISGLVGQGIQRNHGGQKVARISALDPAGPDYWNKPADQRVDESDANFVDAIHMSYWAGYYDRVAHADFFGNPGQSDPDNHSKAVRLFALSIRDATIYGCRVEGSSSNRKCTNDCNRNVVFGEHINENVRGEYCFNRDA